MELSKIYNEDCLETLSRMPDNFIDLVVTSPPYDSLREYTNEACWNFDVFQKIAKELYRVIKEGGCVVWVVGDATVNGSETGTSFRQALFFMETGFKLHDTMIYRKTNKPPLNHPRYEQEWEYAFVFSKGKPKTVNLIQEKCLMAGVINRGTARNNGSDELTRKHGEGKPCKETKPRGNIWSYAVGAEQDNYGKHPAIFPAQLAADHILSWSNEGDLIYDPFGGSGTTCKMAKLLNRNWIMSEIGEKYCNIAKDRIFNHYFLGKDTNKTMRQVKGFFK